MVEDLVELIYPRSCAVCGRVLIPGERLLCVSCLADLPRTGTWYEQDNPVAFCFLGRVAFQYAASFLFFRDGSRYRKLLHRFKYLGHSQIGLYMGRLFGRELMRPGEGGLWTHFDRPVLVPVPIMPRKQRKRGYNQAEVLARGIASATGWPLDTHLLRRVSESGSQTAQDRWGRWQNVGNAFVADSKAAARVGECDLILVDDVITTGATLERCAQALVEVMPQAKINFLSLAYVE